MAKEKKQDDSGIVYGLPEGELDYMNPNEGQQEEAKPEEKKDE